MPHSFLQLNVTKTRFRHMSEFMTTHRGAAYSAATGCPFPPPIPPHDNFMHAWKQMAKLLGWGPPMSVADAPMSGRSWPLQSWARYVQPAPL